MFNRKEWQLNWQRNNKDKIHQYYLNNKEKHKAAMSKKDGKWIYLYMGIENQEVLYVGSCSSLYRFSRQKCCEFAKELIDNKISYVIIACNLDKYITELKDLRLVEDAIIRRIEPKLNDINACNKVDNIRAQELFNRFYKEKMQIIDYKLFGRDMGKKGFVESWYNNYFSLWSAITYKANLEMMLSGNIKEGDYYYNFIENKMYLKEKI